LQDLKDHIILVYEIMTALRKPLGNQGTAAGCDPPAKGKLSDGVCCWIALTSQGELEVIHHSLTFFLSQVWLQMSGHPLMLLCGCCDAGPKHCCSTPGVEGQQICTEWLNICGCYDIKCCNSLDNILDLRCFHIMLTKRLNVDFQLRKQKESKCNMLCVRRLS